MAQTVIESLRNYFLTCPYMKDGRINIDYLPDGCRDGVEYLNALMPFLETARTEKSLGISATCLFASTQSAVSKTLLLLTRKKRCPNAIQHIFPIDKNEHSN